MGYSGRSIRVQRSASWKAGGLAADEIGIWNAICIFVLALRPKTVNSQLSSTLALDVGVGARMKLSLAKVCACARIKMPQQAIYVGRPV